MSQETMVYLKKEELFALITNKLQQAGLPQEQADVVADHLAYADARGVHSHGSVRVEYYAERISKGGSTLHPDITFDKTGPCSGVVDGDNAVGFVVAKRGMEEAIALAKENGIGIVGMRRMGHCGTLSYYLRMAAAEGLLSLSMCQSDPMVVPFGGTQPFFGTNPIGFACPVPGQAPMVFDMATTVGAWGKVLDARAKGKKIPAGWAVDEKGNPTEDPFAIRGLMPVAGAKGYGLMMMVDILSGSLVGVPFGPHVSSMYADLSEGRGLGQLHIVIDPARFTDPQQFTQHIGQMMQELHQVPPAEGRSEVRYPGESSDDVAKRYAETGIPIVSDIYEYLTGDAVHHDQYDQGNPFAMQEEGAS